MSKALVLVSGGIDSAAALHWAFQNHDEIHAISYLYHQRPHQEQLATYRLLQTYPAKLHEAPLPFLHEIRTDDSPEGYIPNRNMIFYSIAAYYAELLGCTRLIGGHTAEDENPFPDASGSFFEALEKLIDTALLHRSIRIELPLIRLTKLQVLQKVFEWNIPLEQTWSCYRDQNVPCGECVSCIERAEVFAALHKTDPLLKL